MPLFVGPDAGNGNLLDTHLDRRDEPLQPVRRHAVGNPTARSRQHAQLRVHRPPPRRGGPRRYDQTRRHHVRRGDSRRRLRRSATVSGTGTSTPSVRATDAEQNFTATSTRERVDAGARAGRPVHRRRLHAAQHLRRRRLDHAGPARLHRLRPARPQQQRLSDFTANSDRRPVRPARPARLASRSATSTATRGLLRARPDRRRGLSVPTFPRSRRSGRFNVDEIYGELRVPILRDAAVLRLPRGDRSRRATRTTRPSAATTTLQGRPWRPVEDLLFRGSWSEGFRAPGIGELFGTPSRFDQEVDDPCSDMLGCRRRPGRLADGAGELHRRRRSRQRQLRPNQPAAVGHHRRQRRPRSGNVGKLGRSAWSTVPNGPTVA